MRGAIVKVRRDMRVYCGIRAARSGLTSRLAILGAAMVCVWGVGSLSAEREG
jgi:hypothetical protein